jgi:hypothetical protein
MYSMFRSAESTTMSPFRSHHHLPQALHNTTSDGVPVLK